MEEPRGNFIANEWVAPTGGAADDASGDRAAGAEEIRSVNPATDGEEVFRTPVDPEHVLEAGRAAQSAWRDWAARSTSERLSALRRFARELEPRVEPLARALTAEVGKTLRESRQEVQALIKRVELVAEQQLPRVEPWTVPGVEGECRYHPLGVIGVVGPFNFPLHLVHAHVIPALATGNTVVIKPSERAPLAAQRYVEAFEAAGLPPVLQMVQGGGEVGRAMLRMPELRGLAFTGSWPTGRKIQEALLDRPEVLPALEMGGQNMAIVLDDADLDQAVEGVLLGGYLTAGQRCTCTSRVLVDRRVADDFLRRLVPAARGLSWGDPTSDVFMGPMASVADRDRIDAFCAAGVEAGAEVLLEAERPAGGAWRSPSIHRIAADHDSDYTREEVFGPDLAVTVVDGLDEAIEVVGASDYGFAVSLFSRRRAALERLYLDTRIGVVNWNRSTNRASGAFPFGGVGKSGNYRPAGGGAVHYTTFPVQMLWNQPGRLEGQPHIRRAMAGADPLAALEARHRIEEVCEPYGLYPTFDDDGAATVPTEQLDPHVGGQLARALIAELRRAGLRADRIRRQPATEEAEGAEASGHEPAAGAREPHGDRDDEEAADPGTDHVRIPAPSSAGDARDRARRLADALQAIRSLHPARFLGRRPPGARVPPGTPPALPRSDAFRARLVAEELVPDDKKPPVADLFRSEGPWLASVDDDPLQLLDTGGQIATLAGGFNPPSILETLWTGGFDAAALDEPGDAADASPELARLAGILRHATGNALPRVAFCGSGAEAVELAIRAASQRHPQRRGLVAFEGSFHGRSLLSLHTTWSPKKREGFELPGWETRWVPWPTADPAAEPSEQEATDLAGWDRPLGHAERGDPPADADETLRAEWASLRAVEQKLEAGDVAAVLVEPMQSEGGERHATGRFHARLRALTAAWDVPLIVDEVQTGVGLGGTFFWHRRFPLPEPPDLVTVAKKAQVGAVLSRRPLPAEGSPQRTNAIRGLDQVGLMQRGDAASCEAYLRDRLDDLARRHPQTVQAPRAVGYAFGFDLPDAETLQHLIGQRLGRGWMIYGAGDRALRFRLHPGWSEDAVDGLFRRLDESLSWLAEGGEAREARTEDPPDAAPPWPPRPAEAPEGYRLVPLTAARWPRVREAVEALQQATYEPGRRDDLDELEALLSQPGAIAHLAVHGDGEPPEAPVVGTCFTVPLEHVAHVDGPAQDPMLGRGNTAYSADVTVHPDHRGTGLGAALKEAQVRAAMEARRPDGSRRYAYLVGRNREGATGAMQALNARYGAWRVARYAGQYGEPEAVALYYRIALTAPRPPQVAPGETPAAPRLDLDAGPTRRLSPTARGQSTASELVEPWRAGALQGALANKLSLANFVTPGIVRAAEALRALAPRGMPHLLLASSRAETADKVLRAMKYHRPEAHTAIALGPVDAGETTAAARSLGRRSEDPDNWFRWPRTTDPADDPERALDELGELLRQSGSERVLGVVAEPVHARTGRAMPSELWEPLRRLTDEHGVPLVLLEHATGAFRSGRGAWRADTLPIQPDALVWYAGGQLGLGYVAAPWYVSKKLSLISTWEGDEVALIRLSWELRALRRLPIAATAERLERILARLGPVEGEGLYRTVGTASGPWMQERLAARGVRVGLADGERLRVVPSLDLDEADLDHLERAVEAVRAEGDAEGSR